MLVLLIGCASSLPFNFELDAYAGFGLCEDVTHGVFEHPEGDCSRYILCLFNNEIEVNCEANKIFDINVKDCVPGDPQNCRPSPTQGTTTQSTTSTSTTNAPR